MEPHEPQNLSVALDLARQGIAVFPVHAGGPKVKQPMPFFPWKDRSTTDETTIRTLWRQYPNAMPAVDVGKSGFLVVDADRHDADHDGVQAWGDVMAAHGFDPNGMPIVATPNAGCHFIFREPGRRFGNGKGSLPKGVDVRGAGGFIVAPGAVLDDGRFYELSGDLASAPSVPDWLVERLAKKVDARPAVVGSIATRPVETDTGLDEIAELLGHIPPDVGYEEWVQALMAVHAATGGSSSGCSVADRWSSGGGKYKPGEVERKWRSFKSGGVNGASLAALARQYGADLSAVRKAHMPEPDREAAEIGARAAAAMYRPTSDLVAHPDGTLTDCDGVLVEPVYVVQDNAASTATTFPPGLVGDIAEWICATARQPQPALALGAALAVVGTAAGRQFAGPTMSATHLYVLGLVPTGQGKDHALQQITRIMSAAQLGQHLGPSEFISMPAVSNFIVRSPLALCPMDEFGDFLGRVLHKRASSFERSVAKLLRSFWGISFGSYQSPEWAGRATSTINCPALSIYGASTPEQFWRAIEGSAVEDGTLNRFLILGGAREVAEREPEASAHHVPGPIIDGLRWVYERSGPLMQSRRTEADADIAGKELRLPWANDEAESVYRSLMARMAPKLKDPDTAPFFARTKEMAVRIATIVAIGRIAEEAVSVEDMTFGAELAQASAALMFEGARDYLADTEGQANAQRVRRILKERGGRVQRKGLIVAMKHRLRARDMNELLEAMIEAGEMRIEDIPPSSGGAPARWYFLTD